MRHKILLFPAFLLVLAFSAFASSTEEFARQAVSADRSESETAISALRQAGQSGLDELFKTYSKEITLFTETGKGGDNWDRIANAIDGVAMQKDAYASKLYWYTDLEEAKKAALSSRKPILSLRLLGNLNEEFSCANSRFFRSILYSNAEIAKTLREGYILHWKSVRPAPRITIDFGDGRKIERTVTGNSIHYILNENGRIIDALPGLYSPQEFLKYLNINANVHKTIQKRPFFLSEFQNMRRSQLLSKWKTDLQRIGVKIPENEILEENPSKTKNPTALEAAPRAVAKSMVEISTVRMLALDEESLLQAETNFEDWRKLARLFGKTAINKESVDFIRRQTAGNSDLNDKTFSQMISNLENYVAIDTVRNEYLFHTKIYKWLGENQFSDDVEKFNDKVYAELFLTPKSDPWLGLYSTDIYTALGENGIKK